MDIRARLQTPDFAVMLAYLVVLIAIGMWVSFRRRGTEDLFLCGRSLGWFNVGLSIFGTNINPSFLIASCGAGYAVGMVSANFEWLAWWFLLLLAMVFVPHYLDSRISTMPQFVRRRFGNAAHEFLAWYSVVTTIVIWLGTALYAGGVLLGQIMNWPLWVSVVFLTLISASFTVAGGLAAVAVTDSFQSLLMILGAAALTVVGLHEVGGLGALLAGVPPNHWRLLRPATDPEFPWPAVLLGYPVMAVWFWCTDQAIVQRVLGARDLRQGQLGTVFMGFLKVLTPFIFVMPGILCYVLHPKLPGQDLAFATMVTNHLPPGMVGLMIAVLVASAVTFVSGGLNSVATLLVLDVYVKRFRPQANALETRSLGQVATLVAAVLGIALALGMAALGKDLFNLFQSIIGFFAPPMAAVFLIGILWKRATATAAIWGLAGGSFVSLSVGLCYVTDWPRKAFWPHYLLVSFYLFAGICLLMVLVSLVTNKSRNEEDLPTLRETYSRQGGQGRLVWILWSILAVIMLGLYVLFEALPLLLNHR
jgi:solute:Na+ symporter, SSS family